MKSLKTIVCIGTGPSLTPLQVNIARSKGLPLYVCNNAYQYAPDARLLYAVNKGWWDIYYDDVKDLPCQKWTTNFEAAQKYNLNWIAEKNAPGMSPNPDYIHHGHGSGYSLVSMAHRNGADCVVLLGYDLKYAPDYDGKTRNVGGVPRHFFGEYEHSIQHWPSVKVKDGVHVELVELYRSIKEQGLLEIVNCTPGSALEPIFGYVDINKW